MGQEMFGKVLLSLVQVLQSHRVLALSIPQPYAIMKHFTHTQKKDLKHVAKDPVLATGNALSTLYQP